MTTAATTFEPPSMRDVAERVLLSYLSDQPVGTRLPPIKELAGHLGVGQSNLHEAMRRLAKSGVVYSRPRMGTYLAQPVTESVANDGPLDRRSDQALPADISGGQPTDAARLVGKRVTVAVQKHSDGMIESIVKSMEQLLANRGLIVERLDFYEGGAIGAFESERNSDVAVFVNPSSALTSQIVRPKHPIVVSTSWHHQTSIPVSCDLIGIDQEAGARLAGAFLRERGFEEVGYLCYMLRDQSGQLHPVSKLRLAGFEAGFGRQIDPHLLLDGKGFSLHAGGKTFRRYMSLPKRPKALFATADDIAVGFMVAAAANGMVAGQDFHLVGFDGQRIGRSWADGALTTVQLPFEAMGRAAADTVVTRLLDPQRPLQSTYLSCDLFVGSTVADESD